ncbi:MAG: DUF2817 domain-containing protein [Bdellovibrionaceae bacterium]|nr:DUF2817 domain-containing protein [Pseudobdellovibrionaceae bacterium]
MKKMKSLFLLNILTLAIPLKTPAINSQSYFKNNFTEAKADFKGRCEAITKSNHKAICGSEKETDFLFIPQENSKKLVIIQSGTHGIEGHAGSGIQSFLIDYIQLQKVSKTSFLFIHGVNPHGFKNNRRVNQNNVDLNRNFAEDKSLFSSQNQSYEKINFFLNPTDKQKQNFLTTLSFYYNSVVLVLKHSKDTLKRAILKGQYHQPKGIYFGGNDYQPEFFVINSIWDKFIPDFNEVLLVDLHTGYGERSKLHLLANSSRDKNSEELKKIFPKQNIDFGEDKEFYQVSGDITSYFYHKFNSEKIKVYALAFEFGTMDSQKLLGSIDSLYRMVSENSGVQNGYKTPEDQTKTETLLLDMFYPKDFSWRDQVILQTKEKADEILTYFESKTF